MMHDGEGGRRDEHGIAAICGLDDRVRSDLYDYVAARGGVVGRDEAAAAAGIGRPLAAYHLDKLVELGLLTASYARPAGRGGPGAGRPPKVYARSGREFAVTVPARDYQLAARLLASAVETDGSGAARSALAQTAREFGADLGRRARGRIGEAGGSGDDVETDAVTAVERVLADHGFEPWRADDGAVMLRNCPFHHLAARHANVVCGMNLALIEGVADGLGATALRPALEPDPPGCCVVIRPVDHLSTHSRERHDA